MRFSTTDRALEQLLLHISVDLEIILTFSWIELFKDPFKSSKTRRNVHMPGKVIKPTTSKIFSVFASASHNRNVLHAIA